MLTLVGRDIEEYASSMTSPEGKLLEELARETYATMPVPEMLTGPLEGQFLKLMVAAAGARRVLEIGMFTGYSALWMAEGLPDYGQLVTCEIDPACIAFARRYFQRSSHGQKIVIREGPALESLASVDGPFDLVFIDADKVNYTNYYEAVMPKVRPGGIVLADNVLYGGEAVDPKSANARAIADFNRHVFADDRVEQVLLTIRDGVLFVRKK
jgi:caffeoyl-CoA O-methyltransferase